MRRALPATRQPVFWAAVTFAAGILLAAYVWRPPLWWTGTAGAFLGAAAFFLRHRLAAAVALALGAFVGVGALSFELEGAAGPPNQLAPFCERGPVTVTGYLLRDGTLREGGFGSPLQRIDLETESIADQQGHLTQLAGGIRLTVYYRAQDEPAAAGSSERPTVFRYGQRIRLRTPLRLPRNYGNPGAMDTRGYLRRLGIDAIASARAVEIELLDFGGTGVEVLAPPRDWVPGRRPQNNDTLVLKLTYGMTAALLEGDAEKLIERLMSANGDARADLLKVGHHGSATSSAPEFLSAVRPRYGYLGGGSHPFGYPPQEVLARLEGLKAATFRTDAHGAVTFYLDGRSVEPRLPGR